MPAILSHRPTDDAVGADVLIVPVAGSPHAVPPRLASLGRGVADAAARAIDLGDFDARAGARLALHAHRHERFPRVLLLGLGPVESLAPAGVRQAFEAAGRDAAVARADSVGIDADGGLGSGAGLAATVAAAVDGLLSGTFRWSAATGDRPQPPGRFVFLAGRARDLARVDEGIALGRAIGGSVVVARQIADTPANVMGPAELAERAKAIADETGLAFRMLSGRQLERARLDAIRAVGGGSPREPRLVALEHAGKGGRPVALVGKGLVYDTGGLSLKPTASMVTMKYDKCGACAVLGAMRAVATLDLPVRVVGVVPAVENSVSGTSYRPGDVIGSRSGKTIDVQNTDAEGRIVLADALDWTIDTYAPQAIVDVATLTGAVFHALGDRACGVLGTDDALVERLRAAGDAVGERAWPLPLWPEYRSDVDTPVADVRNTGPQGAGTIAGAAFLERFVRDVPWAHLDIAGVARDRRDARNGATGFGVRLLVEALRNWPKPRGRSR